MRYFLIFYNFYKVYYAQNKRKNIFLEIKLSFSLTKYSVDYFFNSK